MRGEIQHKVKEVEDKGVMEKKRERERAKAEVTDDLKFNSTMGMQYREKIAKNLDVLQVKIFTGHYFYQDHRLGMNYFLLEEW